jgi:hypothetical protein
MLALLALCQQRLALLGVQRAGLFTADEQLALRQAQQVLH